MEAVNQGDRIPMKLLDCTLRDGGYYNRWNFSRDLIDAYLEAMPAAGVDVIELGFRTLKNTGFKGACAFTSDNFLGTLPLPPELTIGVMVNASELVGEMPLETALARLFPVPSEESPVDMVRIACHVKEFDKALPAVHWLKARGYGVGFNLMQMSDRSEKEIVALAREAARYPLDVLYFADSMGSMDPAQCERVLQLLSQEWQGDLGIHTHDNMGMALQNSLTAIEWGVAWADATVRGMGRGPGNARTEELALEVAEQRGRTINMVPLMRVLNQYFKPLHEQYGWGTNPYYYRAGKYGIHPTYIQEMLNDSRYNEEDLLAVIEHLRVEGGKKFSLNTLDAARHFYQGEALGHWQPVDELAGRQLLLLGSGPGVGEHREALEQYIRQHQPVVLALNTQSGVASELIDLRVACHPVRLLADCETHTRLPQPLITPASMLPDDVRQALAGKTLYDFGMQVAADTFEFEATRCTLPTSLVIAYALAVATSGDVSEVLMAGFDGYSAGDPRNNELDHLLEAYKQHPQARRLTAVTPCGYRIREVSIYGLCAGLDS
jgi:4-hydroxy 2-oxovalerate aldolase